MSVKRFDMHGEMHVNGKYADGEVAQELYLSLKMANARIEAAKACIQCGDVNGALEYLAVDNEVLAKARGEK